MHSLTGSMELIKAGPGTLRINTTNSYTGETTVSGGTLLINGALNGSAVVVERRGTPEGPARVGGAGFLGQGLSVQAGCGVVVGNGTNVAGKLIVSNQLVELGAVLNQFDLSSNPGGAGVSNDVIDVVGNLVLNGTNTVQIHQIDGFLGAGVYPLFKYTGSLSGGLTNLVLNGTFVQPVALTNRPGEIGLVATLPSGPPGAPSALTATPIGALQINLAWVRNSVDESYFLVERSTNNVQFALIATLAAGTTNYSDTGLQASTTYYYRVRASNLAGFSPYSNTAGTSTPGLPPNLTWRGDGTSNVWDIGVSPNWFDGSTLGLYGDGVNVLFDQSGSNSPSVNLVGALQPNLVTVSAAKNYTFAGGGSLQGTMGLTKAGSGTLTINTSNSFTGGVTVSAGTLTLGNTSGAGTGPLRFNGGTVNLVVGNQVTYANALAVQASSTLISAGGNNNIVSGPWSGTNTTLTVSISGSGTFTVNGNMNNFFGTVFLTNSTGFFRFNSSGNVAFGSANTTYDLGTGSATLNNRNGTTITLGALTGGSGTFLSGAGNSAGGASTYLIGGKNIGTTFAGTIIDASSIRTTGINKVGTGTLALTGNNSYSGPTTISGGTLAVHGNQSAATGVVLVAAGGTLAGQGTLGGDTTVQGRLAPGSSIGRLAFNRNLILAAGSMSVFELSRAPLTNDQVRVLGTANLGGTLSIVNITPELLEPGDSFTLLEAGSFQGNFATVNLPELEEGLYWDTSQLSISGLIRIVRLQSPQFSAIVQAGSELHLIGTGGTPNSTYYVLRSTNLNLPPAQWTRISTNQFDANGGFLTITSFPGVKQSFYLLQLP